jgi:hypothetical protein
MRKRQYLIVTGRKWQRIWRILKCMRLNKIKSNYLGKKLKNKFLIKVNRQIKMWIKIKKIK